MGNRNQVTSGQGSGAALSAALARLGEIMRASIQEMLIALNRMIRELRHAGRPVEEASEVAIEGTVVPTTYKCPECGLSEEVCLTTSGERAALLLWEHLTPNQQYTLWWKGCFLLPAKTDRHSAFILAAAATYGVKRLRYPFTHSDQRWCVYPAIGARLWMGDLLLAQKLWLEADPYQLGQAANVDEFRISVGEIEGGWPDIAMVRRLCAQPPRPAKLHPTEVLMMRQLTGSNAQLRLGSQDAAREEQTYWGAHSRDSRGNVSKLASLTTL